MNKLYQHFCVYIGKMWMSRFWPPVIWCRQKNVASRHTFLQFVRPGPRPATSAAYLVLSPHFRFRRRSPPRLTCTRGRSSGERGPWSTAPRAPTTGRPSDSRWGPALAFLLKVALFSLQLQFLCLNWEIKAKNILNYFLSSPIQLYASKLQF
jgi:hypothetical protein